MIRWLKLLTLPDWLVGHAPLLGQGSPATLVLPGLTIVAIVEMALERWPEAGQLVIVDPQASDELGGPPPRRGPGCTSASSITARKGAFFWWRATISPKS